MKQIIIFALLSSFFSVVHAVEPVSEAAKSNLSIMGKVSDIQSGEYLTGVKVKIEGTDIVAYTDFDGEFKIQHLKPGNYSILVEYISYNTEKLEKISLAGNSEGGINIKLKPSTVSLKGSIN